MIHLIHNTPVEERFVCHSPRAGILDDYIVYVKREDLATPFPGPPFSKVRGLVPVLTRLKMEGITIVGYTETSCSMAGWGIAWACKELGLRCIIFDPQYKETPELLAYHRKMWRKFDAETVPLKAGMARVNYNISKKWLKDNYPKGSILLPLGLPFPETIEAAERELKVTLKASSVAYRTIVVNVGSGTVCAGLLKANTGIKIIGVMGRTGNVEMKKKKILDKAGFQEGGLFGCPDFTLVDPGWSYTEPSTIKAPFPCHDWYDLKCWQWLTEHIHKLEAPILFWNIGSLPEGWNR